MLSHKLRGVLCLSLLWSGLLLPSLADPQTPEPAGPTSVPTLSSPSSVAPQGPSPEAVPAQAAPVESLPGALESEAPRPDGSGSLDPLSPAPSSEGATNGAWPSAQPASASPLLGPSEPTTSSPIIILPTAAPSAVANPATLNLDLQRGGWNASVRGQNTGTDNAANVTVSTSTSLGSLLRTFAEWHYDGGPATVQAGLECSLFGPDHWRASRKLQPFGMENAMPPLTEVSVGLDVMPGAKVQLTGAHSDRSAEVGTGLSYKTATGFEWGASVKARRLQGVEEFPWSNPAVEGNLRWSW